MNRFNAGIPTLNQYEALDRCIESIMAGDAVPERIIVIDNGNAPYQAKFPRVEVYPQARNLGVAASWNLILKMTEPVDTVICSDDMTYAADLIARVVEADGEFVSPKLTGFGCFLLRHSCWQRVGPFDETFWPAYLEDNDYHRRLLLAGVEIVLTDHSGFTHAGSATIRAMPPHQRAEFDRAFAAARVYYAQKWGGAPGEETFATPWAK